jgi:glucokinase
MIVGVDIGGTKTRIAWPHDGELTTIHHAATPADPAEAIEQIVAAVRAADLPEPLTGVGVGCPGPLDPGQGRLLDPPNLTQWHEVPLAEILGMRLGVEVRLANDANAAALGEATHGSGKGYRRVFYAGIGTGFGAGIVLDGEIYQGANNLAGEIWAFDPGVFQGASSMMVNDVVSGKGLLRLASRHDELRSLSTHDLLARADDGDATVLALLTRMRQTLAGVLAMVLHLLAPDVVIIGGGLATERRWLVDPVRDVLREHIAIDELALTPILRAKLWETAGLWGAIELLADGTPADKRR